MGLLDDKWYDGTWGQPKKHTRQSESIANKLLKKKKIRRGGRKRNKRNIPRMSYKQYMGSAYWKKRKNDYFSSHGGKRCEVCGKKAGVTLHHKRYNVHYGAEPDDALVALCGKHHSEFHLNFKLKENMVKETNEYVKIAKQVFNTNIDDLSWIK